MTELLLKATPLPYTLNRECDARTAACRALREYMAAQAMTFNDNTRTVRFKRVFEVPPSNETQAEYPSAVVLVPGPVQYGGEDTAVISLRPDMRVRDDYYLAQSAEIKFDIVFECWCTDATERQLVAALVEDALSAVTWMNGIRLTMPFYFNSTAAYQLTSSDFLNDEPDLVRRYWKAQFTIEARTEVLRVFQMVGAHPRLRLFINPSDELTPKTAVDLARDGSVVTTQC